jgi:hypothetical protein
MPKSGTKLDGRQKILALSEVLVRVGLRGHSLQKQKPNF